MNEIKIDLIISQFQSELLKAGDNWEQKRQAILSIAGVIATSDHSKTFESKLHYIGKCAGMAGILGDALMVLVMREEHRTERDRIADPIINQALKSGPKMLAGDDIWVVEGNAELNQLNIKDIKRVYEINVMDWV